MDGGFVVGNFRVGSFSSFTSHPLVQILLFPEFPHLNMERDRKSHNSGALPS